MRVALRSAGPAYVMGTAKGLAAARLMGTGARLISVVTGRCAHPAWPRRALEPRGDRASG